jgi:hypothetical protein
VLVSLEKIHGRLRNLILLFLLLEMIVSFLLTESEELISELSVNPSEFNLSEIDFRSSFLGDSFFVNVDRLALQFGQDVLSETY